MYRMTCSIKHVRNMSRKLLSFLSTYMYVNKVNKVNEGSILQPDNMKKHTS